MPVETEFLVCKMLAIIFESGFIEEFAKLIELITRQLVPVDGASVQILRIDPTDLYPISTQYALVEEYRPKRRKMFGRPAGTR